MAEQIVTALPLTIIIGASFVQTLTWKREDVLVPLPFGTSVEIEIRASLYDDDVIVRFFTSPGVGDGQIVIVDPGVITFALAPVQTAGLPPITGAVWDVKYNFPDGSVVVKLDQGKGRCDIVEPVTRP